MVLVPPAPLRTNFFIDLIHYPLLDFPRAIKSIYSLKFSCSSRVKMWGTIEDFGRILLKRRRLSLIIHFIHLLLTHESVDKFNAL